jgi:hypothetical protein
MSPPSPRIIRARRQERIAQAAARRSRAFAEGRVKGGKKNDVPVTATATAARKTASAPSAEGAAAPAQAQAGQPEAAEEEPEEVYEAVQVVELDRSTLSTAQKEHPYAQLLGPVLVRYEPEGDRFVEVPTADVLDNTVTSLLFYANVVSGRALREAGAGLGGQCAAALPSARLLLWCDVAIVPGC